MKSEDENKADPILIGVVLYKNTVDQLQTLVRAVREQTYQGEITLACLNNCGSDYSWLTDIDRDLLLFDYVDNLGFGGGHNALMAKNINWSQYLALNPDGMLHRQAVSEMLLLTEGISLVEAKQVPHEHPKIYDEISNETDWCSGSCLMISRQAYDSVGGFADEFFMYCEDVDLSWRVRQAGGKCLLADKAWFYHDVEQNDHRDELHLRMHESGVILATKWSNEKKATKWKSKLKKLGAKPVRISQLNEKLKTLELQPVPNVSDFTHNFSFSKVRW